MTDNIDVTITPGHMSLDRQRKSLHWFLLILKCNRISYDDLNVQDKQYSHPDILNIGTREWTPTTDQIDHLKRNMVFHVSKILHKYIKKT